MEELCESEGRGWDGGGRVPTAPVIEPKGGTKRVEGKSEHISLKGMKHCHYRPSHTHIYTCIHVVMRQPMVPTPSRYLCVHIVIQGMLHHGKKCVISVTI